MRRSHYFDWTILTTLGLAGGIASALLLGRPIETVVGMMLVTPIVTGLAGAVLGTSQSFYLRSRVARPAAWIVATCLGLAIGLAAGVVFVEQIGTLLAGHRPHVLQLSPILRALSMAAVGLIAGGSLGIAQRFVFRRNHADVKHWVAATSLGLGAAFSISSLCVDALIGGIGSPAGFVSFIVTAGILFGLAGSIPLRSAA